VISGLIDELFSNIYPGRGIGWLVTRDDGLAGFYFATGRSDESRARRLVAVGHDELEIIPTEHARDPLRHYESAVSTGSWLVVGNGDHVEFVAGRLAQGNRSLDACVEITFEPDPPLCTPRITTIINRAHREV
jgi:IMP cyclohydrolase